MDQMKIVISEAGEKVAGAASDASKKLATLTGEKTKAFPVEAAPSESPADSIHGSTCLSLTKKQRLTGFGSCFVLGYLVNFGVRFFRFFIFARRGRAWELTDMRGWDGSVAFCMILFFAFW